MKKLKNAMKRIVGAVLYKVAMLAILLVSGPAALMAQNTAGDYTAGTNALTTVAEEIAKYVPIMVKLCYAIAGVVAIVGAISVYIAMNNEEQDVKKKICAEGCMSGKWRDKVRYDQTGGICKGKKSFPDKKRKWDSGIFAS